jgi:DNA-binding transcriptional regulator YdaS (Cro superfamily)
MLQTTLHKAPLMPKKTGIQEAVDLFDGSPTKLAAAVGDRVSRQNIEHWLEAGQVPHGKCSAVALATRIPVERLNPTHDWAKTRQALTIGA